MPRVRQPDVREVPPSIAHHPKARKAFASNGAVDPDESARES